MDDLLTIIHFFFNFEKKISFLALTEKKFQIFSRFDFFFILMKFCIKKSNYVSTNCPYIARWAFLRKNTRKNKITCKQNFEFN